eukprot:767118-Hanusia_phi.AAC.2
MWPVEIAAVSSCDEVTSHLYLQADQRAQGDINLSSPATRTCCRMILHPPGNQIHPSAKARCKHKLAGYIERGQSERAREMDIEIDNTQTERQDRDQRSLDSAAHICVQESRPFASLVPFTYRWTHALSTDTTTCSQASVTRARWDSRGAARPGMARERMLLAVIETASCPPHCIESMLWATPTPLLRGRAHNSSEKGPGTGGGVAGLEEQDKLGGGLKGSWKQAIPARRAAPPTCSPPFVMALTE